MLFLKLCYYDLKSEVRNRLSFLSISLYVFSITYLLYFLMNTQGALVRLEVKYWNILYWVIILYSIIQNAIALFSKDSGGIYLYYYTLIRPEQFIMGKIIYGIIYSILLNLLTYSCFCLWFGNPIVNPSLFLLTMLIGSVSFSILYTAMTAISRGLRNHGILTAILGFPLTIPLISLVAKIARESFFANPSDQFGINLTILIGFDVLLLVLSLILYPYIWRE